MREFKTEATLDQLDEVLAFIDEDLEQRCEDERIIIQLNIAVEEIFVNIAHYAYTPNTGDAVIRTEYTEDPRMVSITFIDSGIAFDPLAKPDPDITLPAEQRQIGGLGIYMVKKSMDEVTYERKDDQNIFTIRKKF